MSALLVISYLIAGGLSAGWLVRSAGSTRDRAVQFMWAPFMMILWPLFWLLLLLALLGDMLWGDR